MRPTREIPDDHLERRRVAVPADGRAWRVALHKRLDEFLAVETGERRAAVAVRNEPGRDGIRPGNWEAAGVVVEEAVAHRCPARDDAFHHDLLEVEFLEAREQLALLRRRQEIRSVDEPGWGFGRGAGARHADSVPRGGDHPVGVRRALPHVTEHEHVRSLPLRAALGCCLVAALFTAGIGSGWAASSDTVSTETTTTTTADSTTPEESTTSETGTTQTASTATASTETGPVSATITVTTTVNPTGAAVVGAAAASSNDDSGTDWGWIAFGSLPASS